jgi:hypothetical protein
MGLSPYLWDQSLVVLYCYYRGDLHVSALKGDFFKYLALLNRVIKEARAIVENEKQVGVYAEMLSKSALLLR